MNLLFIIQNKQRLQKRKLKGEKLIKILKMLKQYLWRVITTQKLPVMLKGSLLHIHQKSVLMLIYSACSMTETAGHKAMQRVMQTIIFSTGTKIINTTNHPVYKIFNILIMMSACVSIKILLHALDMSKLAGKFNYVTLSKESCIIFYL